MNPFLTLQDVQAAYRRYVSTFQRFRNPDIDAWVEQRIGQGSILWKESFLQLTRRFERGETLAQLTQDTSVGLHPDTWRCFTFAAGERNAAPIWPHSHQADAIRAVLGEQANVIVATGTGSGKSYTFGIPIVSECLRLRQQGVNGIKAVIIYPINALANSQYDDLSRRLHGSGLRVALYTGDTEFGEDNALAAYSAATGRAQPYDSEVISRQEIQASPPDILMTNYQMLELILTRFEDRVLFPPEHAGALLDDGVGRGHQVQRLAGMAQLPTGLLARLPAQAACPRQVPLEPIRCRWFAAVMALLREARFQVAHALEQRGNLLTLLGVPGFEVGDALLVGHISMLHSLRKCA